MTATTHPAAAGRTAERSRWAALIVLCAGMLMITLDATVVNVALPVISRDLSFTPAGLAWVVNAYLIAFGGLLLLAGRLGDLISRRTVFLAGLGVFTVASLLCALADSRPLLIGARFIQGIGGALTSAVILGMIITMFPDRRDQAKAIGIYAFVASAGGSIGLLAGGVITELINWHWIFFLNLPIGIATLTAAWNLLDRDSGSGVRGGADGLGAVLVTSALMLGVYSIVSPAAEDGFGSGRTLAFFGGSALLLVAFLAREATATAPLIPLRIFRSRNVSGANVIQALTVAGMFGMFFLGVLYLQSVLGYDALKTGLAFLPTSLVMGAVSMQVSGRVIMRFGARQVLIPGLVLVAAGLALFARVPVQGSYLIDVLPATVCIGLGVGVAFPALMGLSMSGATPSDAGLASGVVNTTMQVGAALGLAVLATLSAAHTAALQLSGAATVDALAGGYQRGFWIGAGLVSAALVIAATVLTSDRPRGNPSDEAEYILAAQEEPASEPV